MSALLIWSAGFSPLQSISCSTAGLYEWMVFAERFWRGRWNSKDEKHGRSGERLCSSFSYSASDVPGVSGCATPEYSTTT